MAQTWGEQPGANIPDAPHCNTRSPLAKATASQTASEVLAKGSKMQRGLSSTKVVAVTFPGMAPGATRGT